MKDYESGFLALILAGVLMMVIGIGLMIAAARSPVDVSLVERRPLEPASFVSRGGIGPAIPLATDRKG